MQILINEPLKNYTNYKIGGNTPSMYIVTEKSDFNNISNEDLYNAYILGNGTNILVADTGINKPVIKIQIEKFIWDSLNPFFVTIGAGHNLNEACRITAGLGYIGLKHLSGIPSTIGGAVVMNAGASHGSISDSLIDVEAYNKETRQQKVFTKEECQFSFRTSIFQNSPWIITFVRFQLKKGDEKELIKSPDDINAYRQKNYPLSFPSAGCWFKRDWGGKDIIAKIGMVGAIEGTAIVSPMFPAFILNTGNATAKNIYSLVQQIQNKAKEINEDMPLEIVIWGEI